LTGNELIVETDHQNLQWLDKSDSAVVVRWSHPDDDPKHNQVRR